MMSDAPESDIRAAVADYTGWLYVDQQNPLRIHVERERNISACGSGQSVSDRFPLVALSEGHVWCGTCVETVMEG